MTAGLQQEFLQRTSRLAKLFKKSVSSTCIQPLAFSQPTLNTPHLNLCLPDEVQAELDDTAVPQDVRDMLGSAISDLQSDYRRIFDKAYQKTLSVSGPQFPAVRQLEMLLQRRFTTQALPGLMKHYLEAKAAVASAAVASSDRLAPKFNNAYIPYLKAYFDYNAYPSPHDREVMAKKSMMTSRQIEVWFQNHRRVEKKAGRPCVKRKASDAGPSQSQIDKIEQVMGVFGVSKEERQGTEAEGEKWEYIQRERGRGFPTLSAPRYPPDATAIDVLAMPDRPIPAFVPGYTPFLTGTAPAVYFPPPTWTRRPATQPPPHPAQRPSISELTEAFTTALRIYSDIPRVSDASVPPAATCAITTRLEPGYHPALENTPAVRRMMRRKEAMLPRRSRPTRSPSPGLQRQISWSSASSGSEESLPATPQSTHGDLELEPEPFDDLFDEEPVHEHEVPLDIQGFVYADCPAPVIAVGGKKKKKSHYRT
ncbi:hypothetical protein EV421DRAFT_1895283 [Armillaria borealis]|uniref:Homeobox domain-containing protein n=1 Tax=Armillaria borealis TaxID=47425 RepID=A0AA39N2Q1_9AGAR|nr:hypothetical protein EV421DRAFT_1895283 [Armillaria borealis]